MSKWCKSHPHVNMIQIKLSNLIFEPIFVFDKKQSKMVENQLHHQLSKLVSNLNCAKWEYVKYQIETYRTFEKDKMKSLFTRDSLDLNSGQENM